MSGRYLLNCYVMLNVSHDTRPQNLSPLHFFCTVNTYWRPQSCNVYFHHIDMTQDAVTGNLVVLKSRVYAYDRTTR